MEGTGQTNYRQLAEEIGRVLQAAADTAEKMQEDARAEAERLRAEAEAELRIACAEGRRILDEARMEADMVRAEAEWQSQEVIAQARRQAAEWIAGADARLAEVRTAEDRVIDRLTGIGHLVANAISSLQEERSAEAITPAVIDPEELVPPTGDGDGGDDDRPSAKVYFVEFPPPAPAASTPAPAPAGDRLADPEAEVAPTDSAGASLFVSDDERSEWAPPVELPTWWTRDGAQG